MEVYTQNGKIVYIDYSKKENRIRHLSQLSEIELKQLKRHINHLKIAKTISELSYCRRAQVGCIIVKDDAIIGQGYNGTIKGFDNVCECENGNTTEYVLHAESNAITKVAKSTNSTEGANMYVTLSPCFDCFKLAVQSGIRNIYFSDFYRKNEFLKYNEKLNIGIFYININLTL